MSITQYIGFDVHKKWIFYCVKTMDGRVVEEGKIRALRRDVRVWVRQRSEPWMGGLEATLFSGWIYDELKPYAAELKVAHPAMLKAIAASKKKNDRIDARKIADLLRCDLLPECYMAPSWLRELRRLLRYRRLVVGQAVRLKNRIAGLLMEEGLDYDARRLHGKRYFADLLNSLQTAPSVLELLRLSRAGLEMFQAVERRLLHELEHNPVLRARVELLLDDPGSGPGPGLDLGAGNRRGQPIRFDPTGPQLLRVDQRSARIRRQTAARPDFQTTQRAFADDPDRGREVGAPLGPGTRPTARARVGARQPQPRHSGGGPQAGRLLDGGGPLRQALRGAPFGAPIRRCRLRRRLSFLWHAEIYRSDEPESGDQALTWSPLSSSR